MRARSNRLGRPVAILIAVGVLSVGGILVGPTGANASTVVIPVGSGPNDIALSPDGSRAYVVTQNANDLSVIDTSTDTVLDTVFLGNNFGAWGIALSHDGTFAYVDGYYSGDFDVVNLSTLTVVSDFSIGNANGPYELAMNPAGTVVYVAEQVDDSIVAISTSTNTQTGLFPTGAGTAPFAVAVSPDGSTLYVGNQSNDTVIVMNSTTGAILDTIPVTGAPFHIALSADGDTAYVAEAGGGDAVSVINTATDTVTHTITGINDPTFTLVSPDGSTLFVDDNTDSQVWSVNTATYAVSTSPVATLSAGAIAMAISANGETGYVSNQQDDSLSVISIPVAPRITSGTPRAAKVGVPYSFTITATGSPAPTFAITAGALPAGLTLNSTTGAITGTPTSASISTFTVTAANGVGADASATYSVGAVLANTGTNPGPALLFGFVIILAGGVLLFARQRMRRSSRHDA